MAANASSRFLKFTALAVALQVVVLTCHFMDNIYSRGTEDWFQRIVLAVYSPVNWLTEICFDNSEGNIGAGYVFVPVVMVLYALAFGAVAATIRRPCGA